MQVASQQPLAQDAKGVILPGIHGKERVSYNLKLIENFVARAGNFAATEQRNVVEKLDSRLSSIAHREVWHTLSH